MKLQSVNDLFIHGLQYVYDAEKQLTEALPKLAQAASSPELRQAFEHHLEETKEHVGRAEQVFKMMDAQPQTQSNAILQQMRQEVEQMIQNTEQGPVRDAALIVAGNQVEHYEIACYGSLRNYAQLLGKDEVVGALEKTLSEEKEADKKLTQIGETSVNAKAVQGQAAGAAR